MKFSIKSLSVSTWRYGVVALLVCGFGWYLVGGSGKSVDATLVVAPGDFKEQVSVSGTVTAARDVALGFAASGRIAHTYAEVGQYVDAGGILAEIENGDLLAALAQKRSALEGAKADLASLQVGTRPEEIAVAQTAVANATTALLDAVQNAYTVSDDAVHNKIDMFFTNPRTDARLSFPVANMTLKTLVESERSGAEPIFVKWHSLVSGLTKSNVANVAQQTQTYLGQIATLLADANAAVNQGLPDSSVSATTLGSYASAVSTARTNLNVAAASLTADIATFDSAEKTLVLKQAGSTNENIAAAEAAVAAAQADVDNVQAQILKTRVVAPFSGTVTRMDAKVGEVVSPTTSEIGMQSDGIFQIETYIPEVVIARIAVRNRATTTLDAYGSVTGFASTVVAIDPAETVKDGVPTYKTTLAFLQKDSRIRSGMTANVVIETGLLHDAIVIPSGSVGMKSDGTLYVSVEKGGDIEHRTITTGPSPALGQAHVLTGLSKGDVILLVPTP